MDKTTLIARIQAKVKSDPELSELMGQINDEEFRIIFDDPFREFADGFTTGMMVNMVYGALRLLIMEDHGLRVEYTPLGSEFRPEEFDLSDAAPLVQHEAIDRQ